MGYKSMRGVILAGGEGTRMFPANKLLNKHLIPIITKPMILFPLETLRNQGIEDILIITGGENIGDFAQFLGDGQEFGINLTYRVQKAAGGIAQALSLAEDFSKDREVLVILGDNIFENHKKINLGNPGRAKIFLKDVGEAAKRFGVFEDDHIEEKPAVLKSSLAVTGLYKYPSDVFEVIRGLTPSKRGELEITDVNNFYLKEERCDFEILEGFWSDAGTPDSYILTSNWVYENTYKSA